MHGSTGVRWNVARESAQGSGRRWMRRWANMNNRVFGGEQNQTKKRPLLTQPAGVYQFWKEKWKKLILLENKSNRYNTVGTAEKYNIFICTYLPPHFLLVGGGGQALKPPNPPSRTPVLGDMKQIIEIKCVKQTKKGQIPQMIMYWMGPGENRGRVLYPAAHVHNQCGGSGSVESLSFPWIRNRIKKWLDPDPTKTIIINRQGIVK